MLGDTEGETEQKKITAKKGTSRDKK